MRFRKHTATLFLALFAFVQLGGLHELTHDEGATKCEVCKVIQDIQSQEITPATVTVLDLDVVIAPIEKDADFYYAFAKAQYRQYNYVTRPPPAST